MTAPETVHLSKSVSGALVDFGDVAGSYEYILKSTADANVAAAYEAAAGECYDREDARAIARLATQPQTDALQAMIDAAVKEARQEDAELLKEGLERLEYADQFIRHNRGGGGLHNPARTETISKLRAKIGGAS